MRENNMLLKRGDIFYIDIPKVITDPNKQAGCRPCVIVSNDANNKYCNRVQYVPLTTKMTKNNLSTHIHISYTELPEESIALCESVDSIDKRFIKEKIGEMHSYDMDMIDNGLAIQILPKKSVRFIIDNKSQFAFA